MVMVTFGTTAPDVSVMVLEMMPVGSCARAETAVYSALRMAPAGAACSNPDPAIMPAPVRTARRESVWVSSAIPTLYREKRPDSCYVYHGMLLAHRTAPPLAAWVEQLWYCEGYAVAHRKERVLPNGKFQLVIDLSELAAPPLVVGIRSEFSVVETAGLQCMIGVVF